MKKIFVVFALFVISVSVFAQQESRFTHNMFAYDYANPGYVGSDEMGHSSIIWRNQNLGFKSEDGESLGSNIFMGTVGVPIKRINSGLGFSVYQHQFGFENILKFKLSYSYQFKLGDGKLGAGLYLGGDQIGFNGDFKPKDQNDPVIQEIKNAKDFLIFDMGLGVYYKVGRGYFGLSTINLTQAKLKTETENYKYAVRHYYLFGGYEYQTSNPSLKLKPSVFVRSSGASANFASINLLGEYNNFIYGGIVYSTNNDVSLLVGAEFKNGSKLDGIRLGASYDLITNSLRRYTSGSFELSVGYAFLMNVEKVSKTYKSVRFL